MATLTKRLRVLRGIYDRLPSVACNGLCVKSCSFIMLGQIEATNLEQATGRPVPTSPVQGHLMLTPADDQGRCPYLVLGRCSVHEARPLICRLFGATPDLACSHGCEPAAPVEPSEARAMLAEVVRL